MSTSDVLPKVDCHFHLWDLEVNEYPWLAADAKRPRHLFPDLTPIARSYRVEDFRRDSVRWNVVKSVHINGGYNPADPVGETRYLQSVADQSGHPHGIVANADLCSEDLDEQLAAHCQFANMRGIRHIVNWHSDPSKTFANRPDLLNDDAWNKGFSRLHSYGLSFDLQLYPSQMQDAVGLARRFPETVIILNHCGMPLDRNAFGLAQWRSGMEALSDRPNVVLKISGLGMLDPYWTEATIRPFVLDALSWFGPKRTMFASNFPVDKLYSSYDQLYSAFDAITAELSQEDRLDVFCRNAERYYRV